MWTKDCLDHKNELLCLNTLFMLSDIVELGKQTQIWSEFFFVGAFPLSKMNGCKGGKRHLSFPKKILKFDFDLNYNICSLACKYISSPSHSWQQTEITRSAPTPNHYNPLFTRNILISLPSFPVWAWLSASWTTTMPRTQRDDVGKARTAAVMIFRKGLAHAESHFCHTVNQQNKQGSFILNPLNPLLSQRLGNDSLVVWGGEGSQFI